MRIRHLILASLLPVALGCPAGDDTTDTEGHGDTAHEPSSSTGGEQTTPPGTTTDDTTTPTTTGMDGSSTSVAEESTGTPEGTTTTGMETTTGAANDCMTFCADYFSVCGDSAANDYGDHAGCEAACADYDQATFECKEYHASMADGPTSVHCQHANIDGDGVC